MLFDDQIAALEADSKRVGTQGEELDFALLLDGLAAEREQGITIDVAYRFFSTDTPQVHRRRHAGPRAVHAQHGHRRLDRRLRRDPPRRAEGRAHADAPPQLSRLAARPPPRRGRREQDGSRRLLARSASTRSSGSTARSRSGSGSRTSRSSRSRRCAATTSSSAPRRCRGTTGPTLLEYLETVEVDQERMQDAPFRLPVQWVNRPRTPRLPRLCGHGRRRVRSRPAIASSCCPPGIETTVERVVAFDGDLELGVAGAGRDADARPTRSTSAAAT